MALSYAVRHRIGSVLAKGLEKTLRLTGSQGYGYIAKQLHEGIYRDGFVLGGIRYYTDPCSVGRTPQGEMTGEAAAEMVKERGLSDLHVLDVCSGVGMVGLSMLSNLRGGKEVTRMCFADINVFNISSVRKTLKFNSAMLRDLETEAFLSDNLKNLPADEKFDLIVSNPPHFDREPLTRLDPVELGNVDQDWIFHRDFYADVHRHLKPGGEVWFLENGDASDSTASSAEVLLPFIQANPELEYVKSFTEKRDPMFFWMITRLRDSASPSPTS